MIEGVVIDPGRPPEPLSVELDRGATLRGRVVGGEAELPAGAFVIALPTVGDGYTYSRGAVSADGTYEITGLSPGRVRLTFVIPDGNHGGTYLVSAEGAAVSIGSGGTVIQDIRVREACELGIRLPDRRGRFSLVGDRGTPEQRRASAAARIEIVDATGVVTHTVTPVHGRLRYAIAVAPGEYVIRLVVRDATEIERPVAAEAGGELAVRLERE